MKVQEKMVTIDIIISNLKKYRDSYEIRETKMMGSGFDVTALCNYFLPMTVKSSMSLSFILRKNNSEFHSMQLLQND